MAIIYINSSGTYGDKGGFIKTVLLSLFLIMLSGLVAVQATSDVELTGSKVNGVPVEVQSESNAEEEHGWISEIAEENKPSGADIATIELTKDIAVNIYKITYTDGSLKLFDAGTGLPYYRAGSSVEEIIAYDDWTDNEFNKVAVDDDKDDQKKSKERKNKMKQKHQQEIAEAEGAILEAERRRADRLEEELEEEFEENEEYYESGDEDFDDEYEEFIDERERDSEFED